MELSASQAAKRVGKSIPTITRAIKKGNFQQFRVMVGDGLLRRQSFSEYGLPFPLIVTLLKNVRSREREVELLLEMLEETRADRDSWKDQAQKITALIEDQGTRKKGFWARLVACPQRVVRFNC